MSVISISGKVIHLVIIANIELDYSLDASKAMAMELKRGQAEFHDSFILHSSGPNESENRRCAWIARYVASHVELVRGVRDVFDDKYHLVDVGVEEGG